MAKGTDYTVEKKEEIRRPNKTGAVEVLYRIWATSKGGTYFHVDVPADNLKQADAYLTTRAKALDEI